MSEVQNSKPLTEMQRRLVEDHAYLVGWHMARFRQRGIRLQPDAESDGQWGLILAAKQFKPEMGFQFSTLAGRYIVGGLLRHKRRRRWKNFAQFEPDWAEKLEAPPVFIGEETDSSSFIGTLLGAMDPLDRYILHKNPTNDKLKKHLKVTEYEIRVLKFQALSAAKLIALGVPGEFLSIMGDASKNVFASNEIRYGFMEYDEALDCYNRKKKKFDLFLVKNGQLRDLATKTLCFEDSLMCA